MKYEDLTTKKKELLLQWFEHMLSLYQLDVILERIKTVEKRDPGFFRDIGIVLPFTEKGQILLKCILPDNSTAHDAFISVLVLSGVFPSRKEAAKNFFDYLRTLADGWGGVSNLSGDTLIASIVYDMTDEYDMWGVLQYPESYVDLFMKQYDSFLPKNSYEEEEMALLHDTVKKGLLEILADE
jgi:hypothetical protein